MNYYVEPIGDDANKIIAGFLSMVGDSIEPEIATLKDRNGMDHSVYVVNDHSKITFLKKSKNIKFNKDFKVYVKISGVLVPSFIDNK